MGTTSSYVFACGFTVDISLRRVTALDSHNIHLRPQLETVSRVWTPTNFGQGRNSPIFLQSDDVRETFVDLGRLSRRLSMDGTCILEKSCEITNRK